jgi:starvation-inducible outer membrane lipoprotein
VLACALPLAAAAGTAPTPDQTLNDDVLGPRVNWYGAIERAIRDTDQTCFVLQRLTGNGYEVIAGTRFIACSLGIFNSRRFAPGKVVTVIGNLGAARPRTIGGQVFDYPLVASPEIRPATLPAPDYYRDGMYPGPYGLRSAPGFGYGFYYSR